MNPQMNIKLDRLMVIKKLTDKLVVLDDRATDIKKQEVAYNKQLQKWHKDCEAIIKKCATGIKSISCAGYYRADGKPYGEIEYFFKEVPKLPEKPEKDFEVSSAAVLKQIEEITRMRDILIMCTDETISSKVYQNIINYIVD